MLGGPSPLVSSEEPPFLSHETAIWKGNNQILGGLLTTVANHLLCGMIRQVRDVCFLELPCCQVGT